MMKMDPPAESGTAPATDKTSGTFSDQTTGSFSDRTSVTPLLLPRAKIVLWGDSLTQTSFQGWGSHLANRYQRRADVINRGMSGYNTAWYLHLPDESHDNVALCTIWFGANDASLPDLNPHHYVSLVDYQHNLERLVEKAKKLLKNPKILLITPPPVDHAQRLVYQKERYGDKATGVLERTLENTGKYAQVCEQVATDMNVPCVNLWKAFQTEENWSRFLHDGLHFSAAGHHFVFDQLMEIIKEKFPNLYVEHDPVTGQACNSGSKCTGLQTFGPYHDEIDETCPDATMKKAFKDMAALELAAGGAGNAVGASKSPTLKKPKMDAP